MIEIRSLTEHKEFAEAVKLQQAIWGFADVDLLPQRLFVVASKIGGQVFGAFDGGRMVAFLLAIPGIKPGAKAFLHSHMLGVLPSHRDQGVGRLLKLQQRQDALARRLDLVEWTFDPLETKNAFLNIERLGAVVKRFVRNQYGITTSSLQNGLPTDRLTAEWWVESPRVRAVVAGKTPYRPLVVARISVPAVLSRPREIQEQVAVQFEECFAEGLMVTGFERTPDAGTYLLSHEA